MKVKLLKKVRKRFEIFHLPMGFVLDNEHFNYNLYKLVDNELGCLYDEYAQLGRVSGNIQFTNLVFNTHTECINYLKSRIIRRLRREGYRQRKDKQVELVKKKVWYN